MLTKEQRYETLLRRMDGLFCDYPVHDILQAVADTAGDALGETEDPTEQRLLDITVRSLRDAAYGWEEFYKQDTPPAPPTPPPPPAEDSEPDGPDPDQMV